MDSWLDREHQLRARAEQVAALLNGLWGDDLPPGPDPQLRMLIDAVAGDDEHGRAHQLVVHDDGLTYRQLAEAVLEGGPSALTKLPPPLRQRLTDTGLFSGGLGGPGGPAGMTLSPGLAALPDERCGLWELDSATGVVSFDALCARLLGVGHRPGRGVLTRLQDELQHEPTPAELRGTNAAPALRAVTAAATATAVHPDDRPVVQAALEESLRTGRRYETRFRVLLPDATYGWRISRARVLPAESATAARLVGFITADE